MPCSLQDNLKIDHMTNMSGCSLDCETLLAMTTSLEGLLQCPTTTSGNSLFLNVQSELPWHSSPEGRSTLHSTACLREVLGCDEVTPQPCLPQTKLAKGLQLLLKCLALETFHHLGCPPPDTLWDNVLPILRHPKLPQYSMSGHTSTQESSTTTCQQAGDAVLHAQFMLLVATAHWHTVSSH